MSECKKCGSIDDLRMGYCFDCATIGEIRAAKRTVLQHLAKSVTKLKQGYFTESRIEIQWALERLTRSGDYKSGGYFDEQGIDWRTTP